MSARLTRGGGRSRSAGEGEGRCGRGSGTLLGLSDDGSIVSADGNQTGAQPIGRVVDDVSVGIGSALVGARTGWRRTGTGLVQSPQPPSLKPTGPRLPVGLYVHWRPLEVQSLGGRERSAEGQQGAGLTVCARACFLSSQTPPLLRHWLTSSGSSPPWGPWCRHHSSFHPRRSSPHTGPRTSSGPH